MPGQHGTRWLNGNELYIVGRNCGTHAKGVNRHAQLLSGGDGMVAKIVTSIGDNDRGVESLTLRPPSRRLLKG